MGSNDSDCTEDYDEFEQFCLCNDGKLNSRQVLPDQLKHLSYDNIFSLLHLNIRSLNKHHDDFVSLLTSIGQSFNVTAAKPG